MFYDQNTKKNFSESVTPVDLSYPNETCVLDKEDLLGETAFYKSLEKSKVIHDDDEDVEKLLKKTLDVIDNYQNTQSICSLEDLEKEIEDECDQFSGCSYVNSFSEIQMDLTSEESICISSLVDATQKILRICVPIRLYQARVGIFLRTLSLDEMNAVFSTSKKSTNFYHYKTMCSMPFFNDLTTKSQNLLIKHNMHSCFSLNHAYYFFGHNSTTSIGQEEETGIITGLADYLRVNAPYALHLPSGRYEDFYRAPWATTREFEEKHRELFNEIGSSIRGSLYCLLKRMFSKRNVVY